MTTNDDIELDEVCPDCDCILIEVSGDDPSHVYDHPIVVCPGCLEIKRHEY